MFPPPHAPRILAEADRKSNGGSPPLKVYRRGVIQDRAEPKPTPDEGPGRASGKGCLPQLDRTLVAEINGECANQSSGREGEDAGQEPLESGRYNPIAAPAIDDEVVPKPTSATAAMPSSSVICERPSPFGRNRPRPAARVGPGRVMACLCRETSAAGSEKGLQRSQIGPLRLAWLGRAARSLSTGCCKWLVLPTPLPSRPSEPKAPLRKGPARPVPCESDRQR